MLTLDSGATVSYIRLSVCQKMGLNIRPNGQLAVLAEGETKLPALGEVNFVVNHNSVPLRMRALVLEKLHVDLFAGTTFHVDNSIVANLSKGTIMLHWGTPHEIEVIQSSPLRGTRPRWDSNPGLFLSGEVF